MAFNPLAETHLNEDEVCALLRITTGCLRNRISTATNHPPCRPVGRTFYFPKDLFADWVADQTPPDRKWLAGSGEVAVEVPREIWQLKGKVMEFRQHMAPCVYFLISKNRVVYIGQSISLPNRIETHLKEKVFDRVVYLPVKESEMNDVEGAFIRTLKPRLNRGPNTPKCYDMAETLGRYGMEIDA